MWQEGKVASPAGMVVAGFWEVALWSFWIIFIKYSFPVGIMVIKTNKNQLSIQWNDTVKKLP